MKKITLYLLVLVSIISIGGRVLAQNAPIDFEPEGYGASWTWTTFENDSNPPLQIVANPSISDNNTSATVAQFTALQAGQPWAGCETLHGSDIGSFTFDATNSTVKIMVYKTVISDVGLKFAEVNGEAQPEVKVANTLTNEWEELTFDLSGSIGMGITGIIDQIIIFPDFDLNGRTSDNTVYFDNITFSGQIVTAEPEVAALIPTVDAANVISLYSNVYNDVTVDIWSAAWDNASVADVQIAGDDVKLYTDLAFAGIEFTSQTIDATGMTHFHLDIWTPDPTAEPAVFKVKLVDFGSDGVWSGGDDVEFELIFDATSTPALVTESWISFDLPLASFTGLTTTGHLAQLIISGDPNTLYVDNIYFYNEGTTEIGIDSFTPSEFTLRQNYPNPFNPSTNIDFVLASDHFVSIKVYNLLGGEVASLKKEHMDAGFHTVQFDAENLTSGTYIYVLESADFRQTRKMILLK
ncbi:MAG: T9SS type A sorting domain-containing protein [Candidatus Marinimicrobia bacterium]|nr:T9SS type A sorting domain-containing protein [Candidatus Neomarinimicrobiota bacterium]